MDSNWTVTGLPVRVELLFLSKTHTRRVNDSINSLRLYDVLTRTIKFYRTLNATEATAHTRSGIGGLDQRRKPDEGTSAGLYPRSTVSALRSIITY